jgi:hypothetical protein
MGWRNECAFLAKLSVAFFICIRNQVHFWNRKEEKKRGGVECCGGGCFFLSFFLAVCVCVRWYIDIDSRQPAAVYRE